MLPIDKIRELRQATSVPELVTLAHELLASIGLEYFMFANVYKKNGQTVRDGISQWPSTWFPAYYGGGYFDHNHCYEHMKKHRGALNILDVPKITDKQNELHELTLSLGINSGAITTVSASKPKLGMLYACSADGRRSTELTVTQNMSLFPIIANEIYDCFDRIQKMSKALEASQNNGFQLNQTEILTLMWAAEGLSNFEIASKLGRSEVTVKKHLADLRDSMGAITTAHAVAIAFQNGLMD